MYDILKDVRTFTVSLLCIYIVCVCVHAYACVCMWVRVCPSVFCATTFKAVVNIVLSSQTSSLVLDKMRRLIFNPKGILTKPINLCCSKRSLPICSTTLRSHWSWWKRNHIHQHWNVTAHIHVNNHIQTIAMPVTKGHVSSSGEIAPTGDHGTGQ